MPPEFWRLAAAAGAALGAARLADAAGALSRTATRSCGARTCRVWGSDGGQLVGWFVWRRVGTVWRRVAARGGTWASRGRRVGVAWASRGRRVG
eukprot:4066755-Prymnesium_polylepis.1